MIYMNNITTQLNTAKRFFTRKNFVESEKLYRELFYENNLEGMTRYSSLNPSMRFTLMKKVFLSNWKSKQTLF